MFSVWVFDIKNPDTLNSSANGGFYNFLFPTSYVLNSFASPPSQKVSAFNEGLYKLIYKSTLLRFSKNNLQNLYHSQTTLSRNILCKFILSYMLLSRVLA